MPRPHHRPFRPRAVLLASLLLAAPAAAQPDWETVPLVRHSDFQTVDAAGNPTWTGNFPVRVRGVLLHEPADWLDPTPAYDPDVHLWEFGGQWEIFLQAYDDPNAAYDDGDFGGTACWMGQNYGNHVARQDPWYNYTDDEWLAELERLDRPAGPEGESIHPGDFIEVRARAGLPFAGKLNINEQHDNDRDPNTGLIGDAHDFEVVILERGVGLPPPALLTLADVKAADDTYLFDPARQVGGERYQSTLLTLQNVQLVDPAAWAANAHVTVTDGTGRTLVLRVGRRAAFDRARPPAGTFDVTGVLNQESEGFPPDGRTGYYLMALDPRDFSPPLVFCGDLNCDGQVDFFDIDYLLEALEGQSRWEAKYPDCSWFNGDLDYDGDVDFFDIDPWLAALSSGGECP